MARIHDSDCSTTGESEERRVLKGDESLKPMFFPDHNEDCSFELESCKASASQQTRLCVPSCSLRFVVLAVGLNGGATAIRRAGCRDPYLLRRANSSRIEFWTE